MLLASGDSGGSGGNGKSKGGDDSTFPPDSRAIFFQNRGLAGLRVGPYKVLGRTLAVGPEVGSACWDVVSDPETKNPD